MFKIADKMQLGNLSKHIQTTMLQIKSGNQVQAAEVTKKNYALFY
jgi:hypothetical protein